jgi:drug/metabolite transporter (DMT)-like permease
MTKQNHAHLVLPERSVWIAFLVFIFISGDASVAIRRTYIESAPFWTAASRFILAALLFWIMLVFKRIPIPKGHGMQGQFWTGLTALRMRRYLRIDID